jgi:hypothetical protein
LVPSLVLQPLSTISCASVSAWVLPSFLFSVVHVAIIALLPSDFSVASAVNNSLRFVCPRKSCALGITIHSGLVYLAAVESLFTRVSNVARLGASV